MGLAGGMPEDMQDKEVENKATAISGAFLFPETDAIRPVNGGQFLHFGKNTLKLRRVIHGKCRAIKARGRIWY